MAEPLITPSTPHASSLRASVLVVSRTPALLNQLLRSLDEAYGGPADCLEVLVSWNGSQEAEAAIQPGRLPVAIAQRQPYHFASNMNGLARRARGDVLVLVNDDVIADRGSVDAALAALARDPTIGIVGARIRTSSGALAHAGIHFTAYGSPYHQLEGFVDGDHPVNHQEARVPAVTGAFMALSRADFLQLELAESFQVCGEDVLICLRMRQELHKQILFCPAMGAIHDAESTRSQTDGQNNVADDNKRLRAGWLELMQQADTETLKVELKAAQTEAEHLRRCCLDLQRALTQAECALGEAQQERSELLHRQVVATQQTLALSQLQRENQRLQLRIQQLDNQLAQTAPGKR